MRRPNPKFVGVRGVWLSFDAQKWSQTESHGSRGIGGYGLWSRGAPPEIKPPKQ